MSVLKFSLCESLPVNSRKSMALAIGQFSWQLQQWLYSTSPPRPQCSRATPRHAPSRASQPPSPGTGLWHAREHAVCAIVVRRCHRPRLTNGPLAMEVSSRSAQPSRHWRELRSAWPLGQRRAALICKAGRSPLRVSLKATRESLPGLNRRTKSARSCRTQIWRSRCVATAPD
jgi:hypothetical protein